MKKATKYYIWLVFVIAIAILVFRLWLKYCLAAWNSDFAKLPSFQLGLLTFVLVVILWAMPKARREWLEDLASQDEDQRSE